LGFEKLRQVCKSRKIPTLPPLPEIKRAFHDSLTRRIEHAHYQSMLVKFLEPDVTVGLAMKLVLATIELKKRY
jgi:hypothetical protein